MKSRIYFWLFLFLIQTINLSGQRWERVYDYAPLNHESREIYETPDGGYLLNSINLGPGTWLNFPAYIKTDADGNAESFRTSDCIDHLWGRGQFREQYTDYASTQLSSGNILNIGNVHTDTAANPLQSFQRVELIDLAGNQIWCKQFPEEDFWITTVEETDDGSLYLGGAQGNWNTKIRKSDMDGNIIWEREIDGSNIDNPEIKKTPDGGVVVVGGFEGGFSNFGFEIHKFDTNGNLVWQNSSFGDAQFITEPAIDSEGNIYTGITFRDFNAGNENIILKYSSDGTFVGQYAFNTLDINSGNFFKISINDQDEITAGVRYYYANSFEEYPYGFSMLQLDKDLNLNSTLEIVTLGDHLSNFATHWNPFDFIETSDGGYVITGNKKTVNERDQTFLIRTDAQGNTSDNVICGRIALDLNDNCQYDSTDLPQSIPQILQLIHDGDTVLHNTKFDGTYSIGVDTGDYEVRILSTSPFWTPCQNSFMVSFNTINQVAKNDIVLTPEFFCPSMAIDIGATRFRTCRISTFTVNYCNEGVEEAVNAYVLINLPPEITLTSADVPSTMIGPNLWRFDIGTVRPLECGRFSLLGKIACDDALIDQTLCTKAEIFPNDPCGPVPSNWSKASLSVKGECNGSQVLFTIKNEGTGDMQMEKQYIVIEDIAVMRLGDPFSLDAGEEIQIPIDATGKTVYLEVEQPENHPYGKRIGATVEFCGDPPFSTSFFNQFSNQTGNPSEKEYCAQVLRGYDPNEKLTSPAGFRAKNEIYPDQKLDYDIHFQNTGNDTAFKVVLIDTLSTNLDFSTLKMGASSHDFDWEIYRKGILKFTFENIHLVDSFTNEPGSRGFVKYSILPKEGLAVNTEIHNAADIYFDLNPPIYTNQTLHTIGFEDFDGDGSLASVDCDDRNPEVGTNQVEIPNNDIDEDCDGIALIIDDDMDGFNSDEDCDDTNANVNPNAVEIPNNGIDEDCDGFDQIIDNDGDGYNSDEDCDDTNPDISPGATEIPNNNVDEDCDGIALIIDDDMDGYNSDEDCDDTNPDISPGATEIPNNNVDEDCDGIALIIDEDMDGFNSDEDCDDNNPDINPDAMEIPNNNVDEDCDGFALIYDRDMDGFNSDEDCDDNNPDIYPGAPEIPNNGVDEDCDGFDTVSSTDDLNSNTFKVYPNPANDFIILKFAETAPKDAIIQLFSGTGQLLKIIPISNNSLIQKVDLFGLSQGMYFIKINHPTENLLSTRFILGK